MWDAATGQLKQTLEYRSSVNTVAFSPDGSILVSGNDDGTVQVWNAVTWQPEKLIDASTSILSSVAFVTFSPDGGTLASGIRRGGSTIRLWDAATGQLKRTLNHWSSVRSVAFSPDGSTLASGGPNSAEIRLWDVVTGQLITTLEGHSGVINSVMFSPDGSALASGSSDHTVLLWDMSPYIMPQPPTPDFDGDGAVGFADFLLFVAQFGFSEDDEGYEARFDLDGDGMIGFGDFLIFANAFGKAVSSN